MATFLADLGSTSHLLISTTEPPLVLWAARTFDTALHSLVRLRDNPHHRRVRLLVSHVREDSPTLAAADLAFLEPDGSDAEWVEWALGVCAEHRVDVLWATRTAAAVAAARDAFAGLGTRVLVPSCASLLATTSKSGVYTQAERLGLPTPAWLRAQGPDQALAVIDALGAAEHGICVKPDAGEGAVDVYRLIPAADAMPTPWAMPQEHWLRHTEQHPDVAWIAMPWLPGAEHSVDLLTAPGGDLLAGVVRTKSDSSRVQVSHQVPALTRMSAELVTSLGLGPLSNVQWREADGDPVLLEVNPRPSGGLHRASEALGADLLWAAVRQLLGEEPGLPEVPLLMPPGPGRRTTCVDVTVPLAVLTDAAEDAAAA